MSAQIVHEQLMKRFGAEGFSLVTGQGDAYVRVPAGRLREVIGWLADHEELRYDTLLMVTGVDYADRIDVVYHLRSHARSTTLTLKTSAAREGGTLPSVADIHPAADWHERETFDLLGVRFEGHPNLRRILLAEDWDGHPLRKDYTQPEQYHGIDNQ